MKMRGPLLTLSIASVSLACTGIITAGGDPLVGAAGATEVAGTSGAGGAGTTTTTGTAGTTAAVTGGAGSPSTGTGAGGSTAPPCSAGGIPADVAAVISATCIACHGTPPLATVPSSLATYADLMAPSKMDPTRSVAVVALARMQSATMPMPPAPVARATAAQIATFQAWVSAGTPSAACADGGVSTGGDGGVIVDPFDTPVVCTSNSTWTQGRQGSSSMEPGMACISCHAMGEGPRLALAGTIYPTAHEPDLCNGGSTTTGARIVVTGADGAVLTLTPNASGNFRYEGALATPYSVQVTYMGRARAMLERQTSGDCNSCHTQAGAMMAPGRILLP
jgi:hypothetical protein